MNCCVNCFNNPYIIHQIRSEGEIDNCDYCESENIEIVDTGKLGEYIRECLSKAYINASTDDIPFHVYEKMSEIQTIEEIFRWDEEVFSETLENIGRTESLLVDLMNESGPSWHDIAQGAVDEFEGGEAFLVLKDSFYMPDHNQYQYDWNNFTYVVKHVNRFFDVRLDRTREELLSSFDKFFKLMAKDIPVGHLIWRGRLNPTGPIENDVQKILECGPPPRKKAISLRMNPSGISYFYGAEDFETSSKEIRDSKESFSIYGLFETTKNLRIVDLSEIPYVQISSIFSHNYDHELHGAKHFLRSFRDEVSKPITPDEAQIEYLPTQILTEYIRIKGYDGVRYGSSLTDGFNITLFCGPPSETEEDAWLVEYLQIPVFTEWLRLKNFRVGKQ